MNSLIPLSPILSFFRPLRTRRPASQCLLRLHHPSQIVEATSVEANFGDLHFWAPSSVERCIFGAEGTGGGGVGILPSYHHSPDNPLRSSLFLLLSSSFSASADIPSSPSSSSSLSSTWDEGDLRSRYTLEYWEELYGRLHHARDPRSFDQVSIQILAGCHIHQKVDSPRNRPFF